MSPNDLDSLRRQLVRICKDEIRSCLRRGKTDLETVAQRVERRATVLIGELAPELAAAEVRSIIQRLMKKTQVKPEDAEAVSRQMEFENMEEFRGIPPNIAYEDRPGHVTYVSYLDTMQFERAAALELLRTSIAADEQKYLALQAGNRFADALVRLYGDLPLAELVRRHKKEDGRDEARG